MRYHIQRWAIFIFLAQSLATGNPDVME